MSRPAALAKLLYYPTDVAHARRLGEVSAVLLSPFDANGDRGNWWAPSISAAAMRAGLSLDPEAQTRRSAWVADLNAGEGAALSAFADGLDAGGATVTVLSANEIDSERFAQLSLRAAEEESVSSRVWGLSQSDQFSLRNAAVKGMWDCPILFSNPPYHTDPTFERTEIRFLLDAIHRALIPQSKSTHEAPGFAWGVIPEESIPGLVKRLDHPWRVIGAWRFAPEAYAQWHQCAVLIAPGSVLASLDDAESDNSSSYGYSWRRSYRATTVRVRDWSTLTPEALRGALERDGFRSTGLQYAPFVGDRYSSEAVKGVRVADDLPEVSAAAYRLGFAVTPDKAVVRALATFSGSPLTLDQLAAIDARNPLSVGRGASAMLPETDRRFPRPMLPLSAGHHSIVAAAGVLDGCEILDTVLGPHPWRIKGVAARGERKWSDIDENGNTVSVVRQIVNVTFTLYCPTTGQVITWTAEDNIAEIQAFLSRNADQITRALERIIPAELDETTARSVKLKSKAPGTGNTIYDVQRRTIAGVVHGIRKQNMLLCGEQGTGKTLMLSAVSREVMHAVRDGLAHSRAVVVMCPGTLVKKWASEFTSVTGLPATIVEGQTDVQVYAERFNRYQRIGRRQALPAAFVGASLGFYSGVARTVALQKLLSGRPTATAAHPGVLIISKETAKLGGPWRFALDVRTKNRIEFERDANGKTIPGSKPRMVRRVTRVRCPECARDLTERVVERWNIDLGSADADPREWRTPAVKPICRESVPVKPGSDETQEVGCNARLWTSVRWNNKDSGKAKAAVASMIVDKLRRRYLLVLDECQDYTAKTADQSHAANRLAANAWRTVAATGTLFDGLASSLFYLLYWVSAKFREDWKLNDIERFVATHGIVEKTTTSSESSGALGGRRGETKTTVREVPGLDPSLFKYLIDKTVFLRLIDFKPEVEARGKVFPEYRETVEIVDCPSEIAEHANWCAEESRRLRFINNSEAAKLWAESLYAPNAPRGARTPKETRLVEMCKAQVAAGEKVAVFVTYVNKSGVMDRLKGILEAEGLRVATLVATDSAKTSEREEVLRNKMQDADVLITNGALVQVGLDLLWATLIVVYGVELKTRTLSQQIRRALRINQPSPLVRVVVLAHKGVPEEAYTKYTAKKIRSAGTLQDNPLNGLAAVDESKGYELIDSLRGALGPGGLSGRG